MTPPLVSAASAGPTTAFDGKKQYTKVLLVEDNARDSQLVRLALGDAECAEQRLGLLGMEERVARVGPSLTIESTRGKGTSVYVRIPNSIPTNGELAQWRS